MSELEVTRVAMGPNENTFFKALTQDVPPQLSEAAFVDWVEYRAAVDGSLPEKLLALRSIARSRSDIVHITGIALPDSIPATPNEIDPPSTARLGSWNIAHLAVALQVGSVYGVDHTRNGRLAHDIFSVPSATNNTAFSQGGFDFHVDGAMDPETAPAFFSLQAIRNAEGVPTFAAAVKRDDLGDDTWQRLTAPRHTIRFDPRRPSDSDLVGTPVIIEDQKGDVGELRYYDDPERMRVDDSLPDAERAKHQRAIDKLGEVLCRDAVEVVLESGDIIIVNNSSTAHGRRPFTGPAVEPAVRRWLTRHWIATDDAQRRRIDEAPMRVLSSPRTPQ